VAEDKDVGGFVNCFTEDGTFTDESIGHTYRGPKELGRTVEIYATAFPDMHRELYAFYVVATLSSSSSRCRARTRARCTCPSESFSRQEER